MNTKTLFNDGWEFAKTSLSFTDGKNLDFEPVDLPHDWLIYNTLNLYEDSIGWYRKRFAYTKEEEGEQILLYFDGVYMDSSLCKRKFVGEWKYGYSSFEHDITDALVEGANEILMKVVYQSPNSRWYSGAGIYRNVWLKRRGRNHIVTDGIYVTTTPEEQGWQVEIDTETNICDDVEISHVITRKGRVVAANSKRVPAVQCETGSYDRQNLFVEAPLLWSPEEPNLYQLRLDYNCLRDDDGNEYMESTRIHISEYQFPRGGA